MQFTTNTSLPSGTSSISYEVQFEYGYRSLEDPSGSKSETESCQDSEPSSALTGGDIHWKFEYGARALDSQFEDPLGSKSETESCQEPKPASAPTGGDIYLAGTL